MLTMEGKQKLRQLILVHECYKQFPYTDTTGHLTIGIGRNISERGISASEAFYLLDDDILYFTSKLNHYIPWFADLDEARQIALIDMCFNLGIQGLLGFEKMLAALQAQDYVVAHNEMLASKWAAQTGERATSLANIVLTGEL
jgi:lysozyme